MPRYYLKHTMSCLQDQAMDVDVDQARKTVTIGLTSFDSSLISRLVTEILPAELDVSAFRDDNQVIRDEAWITKPAEYQLFIMLGGERYRAQVVRLFDSPEITVTLRHTDAVVPR